MRPMKQDIDRFEIARKEAMKWLAQDERFFKEAMHQYRVGVAKKAIQERTERVEARKRKIREEFEKRSKACKQGWEKRKERERLQAEKEKYFAQKRDAKVWPRVRVEHGFGGEFCERFQLHCEIPEELMGFDLAAELYEEPESRYDSLVHYLRAKRRKDA